MAESVIYQVKAPDGSIVRIAGPAGASEDEVISAAQQQLGGGHRSGNSLIDQLDAINKQKPAPEEGGFGQGANYIGQQFKKGAAMLAGAPVDLTTALMNLGIAGYGTTKGLLTGSSDLPPLITNPVGGSGTFERLFLTNNDVQPTGPVNAFTGRAVRDLTAASLPIAGMAGRPAAFLPRAVSPVEQLAARTQGVGVPLTVGPALSLASSAGGELASSVVPEPYKQTAALSGQLLGGIMVPAMLASRAQAVNSLVKAGSQQNANRFAAQYVENKLQNDVRNFPGARERLNEALALEDEIPGLQFRVGQASEVPSVLDMERRVATSGAEQFNRRAIQDQEQRLAIQRQAEVDLPLLAGKNDLAAILGATQSERAALAGALPEVASEETGQALRAIRSNLKGRFDQEAARRFQAPVEEAQRLGVNINPAGIFARTEELLSNPILEYKPENAPPVLRRIQAAASNEATGEASKLVNAQGEPISSAGGGTPGIDFPQLKAMREGLGQAITQERTNPSSVARQRLRALYGVMDEVDTAAQQAPASVRDAWNSARQWYAQEYAPRFLRGTNQRQTMTDITGEQRIPDEKLASQYFKKMSPTPMNRFMTLYGDSPQAMRAMENHVLDTYRRDVVKDGVIDPKKHEVFIRNYEPALKQLPDMRQKLDSMGNAARLLSEREAQLTEAQSILDKGNLDKLRYEDHGTLGLDPYKMDQFVKKNRDAFKEAVSSVYGEKVANEHLANLEKITKAATIADRGRLGPNAFPQQSPNPLDLRSSLGFTSRTVFNMLRAVTTGRTSSEDMAFTLGMQSATHRINRALIAAEERAISDPQTAKLIADSVNQPASSAQGQLTLRKILEKGGLYVAKAAVGANNYERMTRYRAAPFSVEATQQANQDQ